MGSCYGNKIAEGAGIRKDRKGLRLPLWTPSVIAYFSSVHSGSPLPNQAAALEVGPIASCSSLAKAQTVHVTRCITPHLNLEAGIRKDRKASNSKAY